MCHTARGHDFHETSRVSVIDKGKIGRHVESAGPMQPASDNGQPSVHPFYLDTEDIGLAIEIVPVAPSAAAKFWGILLIFAVTAILGCVGLWFKT